jgi:Uma2 family endonuclease
MNAHSPRLMTPEDFLVWCLDRDERWELVNGHPVRMMTGATRRHDHVVFKILVALDRRLSGGPCSPHTADQAVRTDARSIRRPDVTVDCGPTADDALEASQPTAVFEVLSPSTRKTDQFRKLEEYKAMDGLAHVVLVDPDRPAAMVYSRAADGAWTNAQIEGLEAALTLSALGISLPLAELYEGLTFTPED